ncbi:unnamed protein product, partial [Symbiodinium microadriaticum]
MYGAWNLDWGQHFSQDGVPTWDGSASTFQAYEEQVLVWEQGVKYENRYLCGPRLCGELSGAAQRMIVGKPPTWVSFNGGVAVFLRHLRQSLGRPQIPEATVFLNKYFRNSRRRVGEGINDYITRKTETYWRACQALKRVMSRKPPSATTATPPSTSTTSWYEPSYQGWPDQSSRRSSWASTTSNGTGAEGDGENEEARDEHATDEAWTRTSSTWSSWSWSSYRWDAYPSYSSWDLRQRAENPAAMEEQVEILPEFVQAWYLLADAGLTTYERNLIHTAVAGDYTLARVSHELRTQHGDHEHRRKEPHVQAYLGEELGEIAEEEFEDENEHFHDDLNDNLDEEGSALWVENQNEINSACAVLRDARRTLKAAREKQHQVKMARKYYMPRDKDGSSRPRDDSGMTCLKCGRVGHRARNCPNKAKDQTEASNPKQMAPFVCYAQTTEDAMSAGPTTQDAVAAGCCVIDGGATKTLGSVQALEKLFQRNIEKYGEDRVQKVDLSERPVFGFGNSTEGQCVSTIHLGVNADNKPGQITVHALDEGEGPVLFSIDALRKLDALIDFRRDLAGFRELDPCKVISLKRSQTGHQLLDLTADLFANARGTNKPVPSLDASSFLSDSKRQAMMRMNKAQLQDAIRARGEEPPREWSNVELRDRLTELMELNGEATSGTKKTDLRQWIAELNKNSKKKELLKASCEERLKITLSGSETIPVMQKKATRKIHEVSVASAMDPVGFGKRSTLTYGQLRREQPAYATWVQETLLEGGESCDYRLSRLGNWLMNQPDEETMEVPEKMPPTTIEPAYVKPKAKAKSMTMEYTGGKGYGAKTVPKGRGPLTRDAPASSSSAEDASGSNAEAMKLLMDTMVAMKEEIKQLREDRHPEEPRRKKKEETETDAKASTEASFTMVLESHRLPVGAAQALEAESWLHVKKKVFLRELCKQPRERSREDMEQEAKELQEQKKTSFKDMEEFLKRLELKLPRKGRGMMGGTTNRPPYFQFGAYRHGPMTGISNRTKEHEQLCRYVNLFLRNHADPEATWTSFVISYNNPVPKHRDSHNDKQSKNYSCSFGRHRIRGKRPGPPQRVDEMDDESQPVAQRPRHQPNQQEAHMAERWQDRVTQSAWSAEPVEAWMHDNTAVEVEFDIPETVRGRKG